MIRDALTYPLENVKMINTTISRSTIQYYAHGLARLVKKSKQI